MDVAYQSQKYPGDYYLDYTFKETTRQLQTTLPGRYLPKDPKFSPGSSASYRTKN